MYSIYMYVPSGSLRSPPAARRSRAAASRQARPARMTSGLALTRLIMIMNNKNVSNSDINNNMKNNMNNNMNNNKTNNCSTGRRLANRFPMGPKTGNAQGTRRPLKDL